MAVHRAGAGAPAGFRGLVPRADDRSRGVGSDQTALTRATREDWIE